MHARTNRFLRVLEVGLELENEPGLVSKVVLIVVIRRDVVNEARQKVIGFYGPDRTADQPPQKRLETPDTDLYCRPDARKNVRNSQTAKDLQNVPKKFPDLTTLWNLG